MHHQLRLLLYPTVWEDVKLPKLWLRGQEEDKNFWGLLFTQACQAHAAHDTGAMFWETMGSSMEQERSRTQFFPFHHVIGGQTGTCWGAFRPASETDAEATEKEPSNSPSFPSIFFPCLAAGCHSGSLCQTLASPWSTNLTVQLTGCCKALQSQNKDIFKIGQLHMDISPEPAVLSLHLPFFDVFHSHFSMQVFGMCVATALTR